MLVIFPISRPFVLFVDFLIFVFALILIIYLPSSALARATMFSGVKPNFS